MLTCGEFFEFDESTFAGSTNLAIHYVAFTHVPGDICLRSIVSALNIEPGISATATHGCKV
jgi:hypothetical protein